ncbi:glycosyltransferase [Bacillus sp. FJAT-27245]|uniref:glycosyltransferase n=1 Tax=Bacillus sp. FJAT-27245 TaxID=1684144 RepID=UPI0006A76B12|nr:glycosyltransferase family A protein [Bacillus sp. FJAT-27245]
MVSVITCTKRPDFFQTIIRNFANQTIEEKELVLILHGARKSQIEGLSDHPLIQVLEYPAEESLGSCLNAGIRQAKYNIIARFDDDDYYGAHYLAEALEEMARRKSDVVGKQSILIYFKGEGLLGLLFKGKGNAFIRDAGDTLAGSTLVFKKTVAERVQFPPISVGEDAVFLEECKNLGLCIYASSPLNYVYIRYSDSHHTSDSGNRRLKKHCLPLVITNDFTKFIP